MRMRGEETEWIRSEYRDCPLYAAVDRFVKDVSSMKDMPAGHPSLLFYLAVYSIDDIKCIGNKPRRLEKCKDLKNDLVYYLKNHHYDNPYLIAAEVIYCVRYSLEALSLMEYLKEISIMSEHINELITDITMNAEIRSIARNCFWGDEELKAWLKGYFDGRDYISERIISEIQEMRKANPPKEEAVKNTGKGNRPHELFTDMALKKEMLNEIKKRFKEKGLEMTGIKTTKNSKELKCLINFYLYLIQNKKIADCSNPPGYRRFLEEGGFSFETDNRTVEGAFRRRMYNLK